MNRSSTVALLFVAVAALVPTTWAGQACEQQAADAQAVTNGMALAVSTAQALDKSGANVVMLARAGQDLSAYGLSYSHLGFVYRETSGAKPVWRVLHKLNHCGTALSALYRQGLGEFFLDRPYRYESAFVVLSPELQARLLPLLKNNARVGVLNEPRYSMVAYAWGQTYQQSNQWAVETLAMAAEPKIDNRRRAQSWMQMQGYEPTPLTIRPLKRLGARATAANVAFDDHPNEKRFADRIETVTVDSIYTWILKSGLGTAPTIIHGGAQ